MSSPNWLTGWMKTDRGSNFAWMSVTIVAVVMILLTLIGVGLTSSSSVHAAAYWYALVPIYALLCVVSASSLDWKSSALRREAIIRQIVHWLGVGVALAVDFTIRRSGQESGIVAGMDALLILALGCFLAGVHLDWRFCVVGMMLLVVLLVIARAYEYLWLLFVLGILAIVGLVGAWLVMRAKARRKTP